MVLLLVAACTTEQTINNKATNETQNTSEAKDSENANTKANAQVIISPAKNETNNTTLQDTINATKNDTASTPEVPKKEGVTASELATHNAEKDCWVGYLGGVYDLTKYLPMHPGGVTRISKHCGTSTEFEKAFKTQHGTSKVALLKLMGTYKGDLI